jgi:hypothetical protein
MTSADTLYKKGIDGIYEIPVSACIVPYIGTTMRVFPFLMSGLRSIVQKRDHVNFLIHPIELIEEKRNDDKINRRSANPIKYILSDVLRHKMKIKNIGNPAKLLLEKQIEYFKNKQYRFITCKQYMEYYLDEQTFECH